jgi:hypothetical protein
MLLTSIGKELAITFVPLRCVKYYIHILFSYSLLCFEPWFLSFGSPRDILETWRVGGLVPLSAFAGEWATGVCSYDATASVRCWRHAWVVG